jgi:daunorubicin resistance ABC transporter ATP-binding subunit
MSTSTPELAIETRGLTKRFGDYVAVDHLDLEVPTGTVVALLGPNGAGKTTVVRMLATLLAPDGGSARVNGYDVVKQANAVRGSISLTGQFAALDPNLTARENLTLVGRLRGQSRAEAGAVADALLERFDAVDFSGRLIKQLSGGQKRRVDLAAGLVHNPKLLVLDEPTTGLDPRSRQVVWSTVRDLVTEGITLLLTTQYLEEADALAERVVLIDRGAKIAAGTPSELKALVGDQRVDVIAVDSVAYDGLLAALGGRFDATGAPAQRTVSIPAPGDVADLVRVATAVEASGFAVEEIALRRPTLDDAFLALTGRPVAADPAQTDSPEEVVA